MIQATPTWSSWTSGCPTTTASSHPPDREPQCAHGALEAGARAYLLKDSAEADLLAAVRALTEGKSFFSPAISKILMEDYMRQLESRGAEDSYELLTNREREILQLLAEGRTNKEVANMLNLSLYTVETHRTHILQKLNLHSVPELILYAVRKGIIT